MRAQQAAGEPPDGKSVSDILQRDEFYEDLENRIRIMTGRLIISSPLVTASRIDKIIGTLKSLHDRQIQVSVHTKPLFDQGDARSAKDGISMLQELEIPVCAKWGTHLKFAIIASECHWEGSLNILSCGEWSTEHMRRFDDKSAGLRILEKYEKWFKVDEEPLLRAYRLNHGMKADPDKPLELAVERDPDFQWHPELINKNFINPQLENCD